METKRRTSTRILLLFFTLCMVLTVLAGCKNDPAPKPDTGTEGGTTDSNTPATPDNVDENGYELDSIPADVDFGGKTVNMLCWNELIHYIIPTDEESVKPDTVEYELYMRGFELEERLNIKFNITETPGSYGQREQFMTTMRNAATGDFDVVCSYSLLPPVLASEGRLYNLNNLDYPELSKPWWTESVTSWEQFGALYFVADNSHVNLFDSMEVLFVNSQMFEDRGVKNPITDVLEDTWYLETMLQYAKQWEGLAEDSATGIYGLVVDEWTRLDALYYSLGFDSIRKNEYDEAVLGYVEGTDVERITTALGKLVATFESNYVSFDALDAEGPKLMKEKRVAMEVGTISHLKNLEDLAYAPIPMPKLDENQDNYRTILTNAYDLWCVPKVATDKELSGMVIEAFASSDYRTVAPYYFEKRLKLRYASDEVGYEMFELIRGSVHYDFGRISQLSMDEEAAVESGWRRAFSTDMVTLTPTNSFATFVAQQKENAQTGLQKLLDKYELYSDR